MTDRAALLAAILAAPDDDAPRLVYADWLDENGEPERAEFIRVMINRRGLAYADNVHPLNRLRGGTWQSRWHGCGKALPRGGTKWFNSAFPAPLATHRFNITFSRGFAFELQVTAEWWLRHADAITAEHPVREVRLTTWPDMAVWYEEDEDQASAMVQQTAMLRQLKGQWPGITFHLPEQSAGWWDSDERLARRHARPVSAR